MSSITVGVLLTQNSGEPATGLTLSDIAIHLKSRAKVGAAVAVIWNGENPTEEIGGGMYTKRYELADEENYEYFAWGVYSGGVSLDSNYAVMTSPGLVDAYDMADAIWSSTPRTLTHVATGAGAAGTSDDLVIKRGDTFSQPITGLGDISTRTKLWVTVKTSHGDTDAEAIIQWEETIGLVYLNGATASTPTDGAIVVDDEVAGDITVSLKVAASVVLEIASLWYDIQWMDGSGNVATLTEQGAQCEITSDITRAIA